MTNFRKIKHSIEFDNSNNVLVCFNVKRTLKKIHVDAGRYDTISIYKYDKSEYYYTLSYNRSLDYMALSIYNSKTDTVENEGFLDNGNLTGAFKKNPFDYSDPYIIKTLAEYCY